MELLSLIEAEVERTALNYESERLLGGSLSNLPPFIVSIDWSAPRPNLPDLDSYILHSLSGLCKRWEDNHVPLCTVRVHHVLLHHGMLEGNTFPLIRIGDFSGDGEEYHRLSEKGRLANDLCSLDRIRALGNILAVCGTRVSGSHFIQGVEMFTIATRAPFSVGWYLERCECNLIPSDTYFNKCLPVVRLSLFVSPVVAQDFL